MYRPNKERKMSRRKENICIDATRYVCRRYKRYTSMKSLEKLSDANVLVDAFKKASAGSIWKSSVQKYEINLLRNIRKTQTELLNGSYQQGDFLEFELNERGHNRRIKALGIADRVVQRTLFRQLFGEDV